MKVLIVSDTHGRHSNLDEVFRIEGKIDLLIHLGDVEDGEWHIREVSGCPYHLVAGNNDYFSGLPKEKEISIGKYKVWLNHGHGYYVSRDKQVLRDAALARGVDMVLFGHTHKPYINIEEKPFLINPGSISYPRQEGRKASYVVMEIGEGEELNVSLKYLGE